MSVLGIDLRASSKKPSAVAILDSGSHLTALGSCYEDGELTELVGKVRPDLIAIGAPLNLPSGFCCLDQSCNCWFAISGRKGRLLELELVQTLKAGVMEIADVYVVNKADRDGANQMASAITGMLHMATVSPDWNPPVLLTAANTGQGIEDLWLKMRSHREFLTTSGGLEDRRETRRKREFLEAVEEVLAQRLRDKVENDPALNATLEKVAAKETDPYSAALEYLESSLFSSDWLNPQ